MFCPYSGWGPRDMRGWVYFRDTVPHATPHPFFLLEIVNACQTWIDAHAPTVALCVSSQPQRTRSLRVLIAPQA